MQLDKSIDAVAASSSCLASATGTQTEARNYRPVRCCGEARRGEAVFASALAVEVARLLDVDPAVDHWRCRVTIEGTAHIADFAASGSRGEEFLIVASKGHPASDAPPPSSARYVGPADIDPVRLENARAILPFARWRVSLDDRIRLLAVLDEEGSVTLAECLGIFRNTARPIAAVASLAIARLVDLELDEPIGSRTRVIRREA